MKLQERRMTRFTGTMVLILGAFASSCAIAQAPAGATGQCKDNSYTKAAKKWQACAGHQGVQTWYADASAGTAPAAASSSAAKAAPAAAAPATAAPAAAAQPAPAAKSAATTSTAAGKSGPAPARTTAAPGGGPGMVWVNTSTKVYHCPGTTFYGKTKEGKYMSEADAKSAGAHADRGAACTK